MNLLTHQLRRRAHRQLVLVAIRDASELLLLYCSVLAMVLLLGHTITERNFAATVEQSSLVLRTSGASSSDARATNELLLALEGVHATFAPWSVMLTDISPHVPAAIMLTEISVDRGTYLRLDGRAASREDLLELRDALPTIPYLAEINVPFSNLLQRERIDFSIQAQLTRSAIPIPVAETGESGNRDQ